MRITQKLQLIDILVLQVVKSTATHKAHDSGSVLGSSVPPSRWNEERIGKQRSGVEGGLALRLTWHSTATCCDAQKEPIPEFPGENRADNEKARSPERAQSLAFNRPLTTLCAMNKIYALYLSHYLTLFFFTPAPPASLASIILILFAEALDSLCL